MLKRWNLIVLVMIMLAALWGCSDDDDGGVQAPAATAFEVMAAAGETYVNNGADCPGVINATDLQAALANYTVIDIRALADYDLGHIQGAYHSTLGTLIDDLTNNIPAGKPYVIACYTGQSAGHAKIAMELLGYTDVKSLLFGMSAWNSTLDGWTAKCADELGTAEVTDQNPNLSDHAFPVLSEAPGTVVATRVGIMLANGFKGKMYTDIKDNLGNYFIMNYFGRDDYMGTGGSGVPGHIPGAFQFTPYASLGTTEMLKNLPTNKPIIVYCWTGQHSSQVTAYLNMLGYEAYSLKFGSNNLFHASLTAHKWGGPPNDFPLIPTPTP